MRTFALLKYGFLALALSVSIGSARDVYATTSTLHIEQKSPIAEYSHWELKMPGDATYKSTLKSKILNNIDAGTYVLSVVPPHGAFTTMTIVHSGTVRDVVHGSTATIELAEGETLRVTVSYSYTGNIRVLSDPAGVPFEMKDASNKVYTGVTPALFTDMAPVWYRVQYAVEADCEVQEDQQRGLVVPQTLTFWADFTCGDREIPVAGRTPEVIGTEREPERPRPTLTHEDMPDNRILQTASMSEVVAGGRIKFTIAVTNSTRSTIHNVLVSNAYDPSMIDIELPLLDGGVIGGENEMMWDVPKIYARQTWTTSFYARAHEHLVAGDRIVLTAKAISDETDFELYPEAWSSTVGVGVAYMPQTGDTLNLVLVLSALAGTGLLTNFTYRRKQSVAKNA